MSGIDFVSDATTDANGVTRCLAKDSAYIIATPIFTANGYKLVKSSSLYIVAVNTGINTIVLFGNNKTLFTGDDIQVVSFESVRLLGTLAQGGTGQRIINLKGNNNVATSINLYRSVTIGNVASLGILQGASFTPSRSIFIGFASGYTFIDSILNIQGVGILPAPPPAPITTFATIRNRVIRPTPKPISLSNISYLSPPNQIAIGFDIDPATTRENTFVITNVSANAGLQLFKKSATALTGDVARFQSAVFGGITDVNNNGGFADLATPFTTGLVIGDTIFISGTSLYDGPDTITGLTATEILINKTFVTTITTITGQWDKVGSTPTTIITSAAHGLVDTNDVKIENSINYNQQFDIQSITNPTTFVVSQIFRTSDVGIAKFTQIRNIDDFSVSATLLHAITTVSDNGEGGVTISGATLPADFLDGRRVLINGTNNAGTGATATAILTGDAVTSIEVNLVGASYDTPPIVRIGIEGTGSRATAVATVSAGVVTAITVTSGGSGYTVVPTITLISTDGDYDGEFKIFNVTATTFDILVQPFVGSSTGSADIDLTSVISFNHNFVTDNAVLIDKTVQFDEGYIVKRVDNDSFTIDKLFISKSDIITGTVSDDSLDGRAKNVLVNTVSGELNSKAKGSFSVNGNITPTTFTASNQYQSIILTDATNNPPVVETQDTQRWRLIPKGGGKFVLRYTGTEPFDGDILAPMSVTGSNANTYTFRAVKNGGVMVDDTEESFTFPNADVTLTFTVSITAEEGDEFDIQVKNDGAMNEITIKSITDINQ